MSFNAGRSNLDAHGRFKLTTRDLLANVVVSSTEDGDLLDKLTCCAHTHKVRAQLTASWTAPRKQREGGGDASTSPSSPSSYALSCRYLRRVSSDLHSATIWPFCSPFRHAHLLETSMLSTSERLSRCCRSFPSSLPASLPLRRSHLSCC